MAMMHPQKTVDRLCGLFVCGLGLLLLFVVFPAQIESLDDGSIRPDTLPNALAWILVVCGTLLALRPGFQAVPDPRQAVWAFIFIALLAAGLFAMSLFGFLKTAPVLALLILLLFGERRPLWLGFGVAGLPAIIWFLVAYLLERPLP